MTICVFTGGVTAFNVQRAVENWGQMLAGLDTLHLVTCEPTVFDNVSGFEIFSNSQTGALREVRVLRSYLSAHNPSVIVHITEGPIHGTITAMLAQLQDVPAVYRYAADRFHQFRLHNGVKKVGLYGLNNLLGRVPLYLANQFIALGPQGRARLIEYGVPPELIHILPPTIDPSRFDGEQRADLAVPDNRSVVMFLGRISRLKGIEVIERTIGRILDRRPDLHFVFVGEEERRPDIAPEYEDNVLIVGRVPPESVPTYLRRADVLAHPSLTEGVPRAVLESLFAGTPVIARDVGDIASVTKNTFRTDQEFIEMLCSFEDLPLDDPTPFSVASLQGRYRDFFSQFIE